VGQYFADPLPSRFCTDWPDCISTLERQAKHCWHKHGIQGTTRRGRKRGRFVYTQGDVESGGNQCT